MEAETGDDSGQSPKAAWESLRLGAEDSAGANKLQDSLVSGCTDAPSVEFLAADLEAMRALGMTILDEPSSWDNTFAPGPDGELVRQRTVPGHKATDLFTGTHGPHGLTSLALSAKALDSAKVLGGTASLGNTLSADCAVRGHSFTWVRGENVGSGSMGSVFKGLDQKNGEIIAIKEVLLDESQTSDMRYLKALENEISIIKELRHPRIVSFFGSDYIDCKLYLYLEYMPGGSLAQVILDFGALDESLTAMYTSDIVEGLQYLHSREPPVLHRDIKGANILVGLDCRVKLTDFGCSKRTEDLASATMKGSIPWMAPEIVMQKPSGRAADVWSLGCVTIEMASGKPPWGGFDNHMAAMYKIGISKEKVPIPDCLSELGQDFVGRCVDRDQDKRSNAEELMTHAFVEGVTLRVHSMLD